MEQTHFTTVPEFVITYTTIFEICSTMCMWLLTLASLFISAYLLMKE